MKAMDSPNRFLDHAPNPITHARHRREVFWQIIFPLLLAFLLLGTVVAILIFSGTSTADLSRWADVSLIWLILPALIIALLFLIILVAIIYLITVVLQMTPRYARIIQLYFEIGKYKISHITNQITEPIIKVRSLWSILSYPRRSSKRSPGEQ